MLTRGQAGAQPQPRQLLRRDRAGGLPSGPRGARHRLQQRPAAAGAAVLVHRHAAVAPGRPQLPRAADQPRRLPVPQLPARRHAPHAGEQGPGRRTSRTRWPAARSSASTAGSRASRASPRRSSRPRSAAAARASTTTSARRRLFWNSQSPAEKEHIIAAFQFELSKVEVPAVRQRVVDNLAHVDAKLARKVAEPLGIALPDAKAAAGRAGFRDNRAKLPLESVAGAEHGVQRRHGIATRKVAVLVADGRRDRRAARSSSRRCRTRARPAASSRPTWASWQPHRASSSRSTTPSQNMPSVMFDAVLVPGGAASAQALARNGDAVHFVLEAYKHCKTICVIGEGVAVAAHAGHRRGRGRAGRARRGDRQERSADARRSWRRTSSPRWRVIATGRGPTSKQSPPDAAPGPCCSAA